MDQKSLSEVLHVNPTLKLDDTWGRRTSEESSSSYMPTSSHFSDLNTLYSRMSQDSYPLEIASTGSSPRLPDAGIAVPGEYWIVNTSGYPSGDVEYTWSDYLGPLQSVPSRYFITPKGAAGIYRRAIKRRMPIPLALGLNLVYLMEKE